MDLKDATWRKTSRSDSSGGNCVELAVIERQDSNQA